MRHRALFSVYDKTGIVELAMAAAERYDIISSGGTAKHLRAAGVPVTGVSDITGFPEILDGRLKTLHPIVHGGILTRRNVADAAATIANNIVPFDLVVVNLYPFADVAASSASPEEIIEMIDIGGPTMLRAAAKNYEHVTVVSDPQDYTLVSELLKVGVGKIPLHIRRVLAYKAFRHSANYESAIARWFSQYRWFSQHVAASGVDH